MNLSQEVRFKPIGSGSCVLRGGTPDFCPVTAINRGLSLLTDKDVFYHHIAEVIIAIITKIYGIETVPEARLYHGNT